MKNLRDIPKVKNAEKIPNSGDQIPGMKIPNPGDLPKNPDGQKTVKTRNFGIFVPKLKIPIPNPR